MAKTNLNNRNKSILTKKNRAQTTRNGIKKRLTLTTTSVQDARHKILQKKRKTVVDARDVLAKMAKTQDARGKLNKIRQNSRGHPAANGNVKIIGNIVQKTDRNGKISLSTSKAKSNPAPSNTNMNLAIKKQLGLVNNAPRVFPKKSPLKRTQVAAAPKPLRPLRKTILNDMDFSSTNARLGGMYDPAVFKWAKPQLQTASNMIHSLDNRMHAVNMHGEFGGGWNSFPVNSRIVPAAYVDLDAMDEEEMPLMPARSTISLQGSSRVSNVLSRLDSKPIVPQSHGILSQAKTKVVVPAGHRIVVSNLQSTVTQDDIKELFEDIGQLLTARLVRSGVAEVIYKNLKDAQKAVDTYHNRQLDGFPMKCLLVNKRPINQPTASVVNKTESHGIFSSSRKSNPNALVPDISTIHKVLFQRK